MNIAELQDLYSVNLDCPKYFTTSLGRRREPGIILMLIDAQPLGKCPVSTLISITLSPI